VQEELIPVSYSSMLVLLSFCISAVGSYTALSAATAAARRGRPGQPDLFNLMLAGAALGGVAIWSMHFIGMVAWQVDIGVGYRWVETAVSLVAAVAASTVALGYMAAGPMRAARLLTAGPLTGLGVAVMHYLGMYAMRFDGYFQWDLWTVAVSVLIAMAAATAALWLAFNTTSRLHRAGAALVMATAVCTMHYVGMSAASVICTSRAPSGVLAGLMRPEELPTIVTLVAVAVLCLIGSDLAMQRFTAASARARQARQRL